MELYSDPLLRTGQQAAEELKAALAVAGVKFPSLICDYPVRGCSMVHLGRVTADEAMRLARWIAERAGAPAES